MEDNELFELCKEVYKKTGWGNTGKVYANDWKGEVDSFNADSGILKQSPMICPFYTSDYLLGQLPTSIPRLKEGVSRDIIMDTGYVSGEFVWRFGYDNGFEMDGTIEAFSDTPLKALLKLTLKLSEEEKL